MPCMPWAPSPSAIAWTSSACSPQKSAIWSKVRLVFSTSHTAVAFGINGSAIIPPTSPGGALAARKPSWYQYRCFTPGSKVEQSGIEGRIAGPKSRNQDDLSDMGPGFDQQMRAVGIDQRKRRRDHLLDPAGFESRPD